MTTDVQPFAFDGSQLRVVTDEHGQPWFVATDVARALGHRDAHDLTRWLDDDEKGARPVRTVARGVQTMTCITEPGLYSAILARRSSHMQDPAAATQVIAFQRWVTHEVLPAIRRTGTYTMPTTAPPLQAPPSPRELAALVIAEADRADAAEARVAELEPAAAFLDAAGDLAVADAAGVLSRAGANLGRSNLFAVLRDQRWIYRGASDGQWRPYRTALAAGWLATRARTHPHPHTGARVVDVPQVRVTPKGLRRLADILDLFAAAAAQDGGR